MITCIFYLLIISSSCVLANEHQFSTLFSAEINVSTSCQAAIHKLSSLEIQEPHVMAEYWDSWGKLSHGVLKGHTEFLGYYDECINLKNTVVGETKFCIFSVHLDVNSSLKHGNIEGDVCLSSNCIETNESISINIGACFPSGCTSDEFGLLLSKLDITSVNTMASNPISKMKKVVNVHLTDVDLPATFCPQTEVKYNNGTTVMIIVCSLLVGLVIVGTSLDIMLWALSLNNQSPPAPSSTKDDDKSISKKRNEHTHTGEQDSCNPTIKDFILAFSLYTTVPILLNTTQSPSAVKAVGGMKIIANFVIMIFHVYLFILYYYPIVMVSQNTPEYLLPLESKFAFQPVMNITFSVDTFIFISAILSAYLTFKDIDKYNGFRCVYFYLNRYFRLSVLFYFITIISATSFVHFGQGPVWRHPDYTSCTNNWWYNIFYITNALELLDMCISFSWNICIDMQLFIVSPILILLLHKRPFIGLIAGVLAMVGTTTAIGVVSANNEYRAAMFKHSYPKLLEEFSQLYAQPYFRVNVYVTGIFLGYVLYKKYNIFNLLKGKLPKMLTCATLWCTSTFLCLATLFGTHQEFSGAYLFSNLENTVYLMFSGLGWSIGIFIIIYMCNTGYGGVVNSILSWPGWEPFVRLSYCVYLVHQMVLFVILGTLQSSLIITNTVFTVLLMATWVISYGLSAVIVLVVELPILKIVSLCFQLAGMNPRNK